MNNIDAFKIDIKFDVAILCSGLTNISECEKNLLLSKKINYDAQIQIIRYLSRINPLIHIIFISTSAVFSGKKSFYRTCDTPDPTTIYGKHKYEVEKKLNQLHQNHTILRLTKVLTPDYPLIQTWIKALENEDAIYPYKDLYLCPVSISHVTNFIFKLIEHKSNGIVHLSGIKDITYYELGLTICKMKKFNPALVEIFYSKGPNVDKSYSSLMMDRYLELTKDNNYSLSSVLGNLRL